MDIEEISSLTVKLGMLVGADEVAAKVVHETSRQVRFANNEVTATKNWDEIGVSILFKKNRRILVASTTDVTENGIQSALTDLFKMVNVIGTHKDYASLPEGPFKYKVIPNLFDDKIPKLGDKLIDYVESAINSSLENGAKRVSGTLLTTDAKISLSTSNNVKGTQRKTTINLVVRSLANAESSGMGVTCGTMLKEFDAEQAGRESGILAGMSLDPLSGKSGRYDVIFSRPASAVLFDIFAGMDSAFNVDSGQSCLVDKLGEKIAPEDFTLYDDAVLLGGMGSTSFDDEGYPAGKTAIIKHGVLKSYLHNSLTSKKFKTKSTANAGWISPRAWNIVLEEGKFSKSELLKEVEDGLYVNNITYVRFQDYRKGDFSAIIRDGVFKIENGEITRAVKGLRLSENLINLIIKISGLSKNVKQISHWWQEWGTPSVWTPLVLSRGLTFTTPTK